MEAANSWVNYINFKKTDILQVLDKLPHLTIGIYSGNQAGKTASVAKHYVDRLLGKCSIEKKNKLMRKVRCMSPSLPESTDMEEQDNTQYLELKRLIPPEMIVDDIKNRSRNLIVRRPIGLSSENTIFEFKSSQQEMQKLGRIQISSLWHDEETPKAFREECRVRLLKEGGDEIFSLTPTNALSYCFDEIWQRKSYIYRTKTIADKFNLPRVDTPNGSPDIACIQMATDDNPTLEKDTIDRLFEDITDPDELAIRRYGVFKQISGRVHKTYNPEICYIDGKKYFPDGIPWDWTHARGIDYHESRIPWSIGWLACSPKDEWFLYQEFHPAIDGPNAYNTYEIATAMARKSGDYEFIVNLIDALAKKKQANTNFSTVEDLNRYFDQIRQEEGIGRPSFWQAWDTKGTSGRSEISKRFKNSVRCGKPFNNMIRVNARKKYLPTLWIFQSCPNFHKSILNWRYGEYVTAAVKAVNDPKPTPQQKNSHDNMVLECLAKDSRLLNASHFFHNRPTQLKKKHVSVTGR